MSNDAIKHLKRVIRNIEKGIPSFKHIVISEQEKIGVISIFHVFAKLLQKFSARDKMNILNIFFSDIEEKKQENNVKK